MFVYISLLLLIIVSKQQCQSADVGNGAILVSTNIMDLMVYVDVEDHGISQTIREKGGHNRQLVDLLCKFVRNEESVVHVGAHIGLQTLAIGKYIKNKNFTNSFVHSFEPNQLNYILLVKSVYINDLQDIIHVYKTSISNEQGQSQIAIRNSDTSLAEIVFNSATKRKADYKYSVTTTTVDNVLKGQIHEGMKFGLFYISCNTFEIQALMGMRTILAANRQAGIFVHWLFGKNPHKNVDGLIVTLKQLQQALYQLFVVDQNPIGSGEIRYRFRKLDNFMDIIKINEANLLFVPLSKIKNIEG